MKTVELLNRVYEGRRPLLSDDREYAAALEEIGRQSVAGQIYQELREHGLLDAVPDFFRAAVAEQKQQQTLLNLVLKAEGDRIVAALGGGGISTILLKGTRLSERLYGNAGLRGTSDIDLLVKPEDMQAAGELISRMGYRSLPAGRKSPYHTEFAKPMPSGGLDYVVELHWHLVMPRYFRMECRPLWERALPVPSGGRAFELSASDLFYTLCLHGAKHGMSSLKNVLDIVAVLRRYKEEIGYRELLERARAEDTYGMVVMCLSVVYRLFPSLHAVKPFPACRRWFPWDQGLAWKRESGFKRFRGGFPFYLQRTIFELAKYDRNRYRIRYLRSLLFSPKAEG